MTLTAHDWVTRSAIDPAVLQRWPSYQVTLVATDHANPDALASAAEQLHRQGSELARTLDPADPDAHIARWHQAYRDFGVKPRVARVSVDAIIRRAASDKGLPRINVLVDLYNALSILHRVPIGGEDLDRYEGPAQLVLASGNEPFHTTADGAPTIDHPDPGEPIWTDARGVTCRRWNWRQTTRTAIQASTTRVAFIIDSHEAPGHHGAARAAQHLAELLPETHARTIDISTS
jgi:DNA/RNA-binding domain of Phe-tRNA-synthetase-like protein